MSWILAVLTPDLAFTVAFINWLLCLTLRTRIVQKSLLTNLSIDDLANYNIYKMNSLLVKTNSMTV